MNNKPKVKLVGSDGDAFNILGLCQRAAKKAGWKEEEIKKVLNEMRESDYDHLLQTAIKYFDVV